MTDNVHPNPYLQAVAAGNACDGDAAASMAAQAAGLAEMRRGLTRGRLKPSQTPANRQRKHEQKQAKLALDGMKDQIAVVGTLATIADQIGFQSCPLLPHQLRGALLDILASAKNPIDVARYEQRDLDFIASKRRKTDGVFGFVTAAHLGSELKHAARDYGLRHNLGAGGFEGRTKLSHLLALGQNYNATISVVIGKERHVLVDAGVVALDVLELLDKGVALEASLAVPEAVSEQPSAADANVIAVEAASKENDDTTVESDAEANTKDASRPAMPFQRSIGGRRNGG